MRLYDSDGDGKLSPKEQQGCPGIARNVQYYDKDEDGEVSPEELQARIERWIDEDTGLMSFSVGVKFKGLRWPARRWSCSRWNSWRQR